MKIKKYYSFDNKRQIWRIIPTDEGKLVIEERDTERKQAYFNCLELDSGKKLLRDFQLDDKFWIGIEAVKGNVIYFHKYAKPDMPGHKGIFAFDLINRNILWQSPDIIFQFIYDDKIYAYHEGYEGRNYFSLNALTGEVIDNPGEDYQTINSLRTLSSAEEANKGYLFAQSFEPDSLQDSRANEFINQLRNLLVISGEIEFILKNELLLMSFHEINPKGTLNNLFKAVDLSKGKYILEETLNKGIRLFMSDSFFIKNNMLFVLFGKTRLVVYKIIN